MMLNRVLALAIGMAGAFAAQAWMPPNIGFTTDQCSPGRRSRSGSVAADRRAALKRRNQARNRRQQRSRS